MRPRIRLMLLAMAIPMLGSAGGGNQPAANHVAGNQAVRLWTAAGGEVQVRWNHELARDLGIRIVARNALAATRNADGDRFSLRHSGRARFRVEDGYFRGFRGGALQASGGYRLDLATGGIALDDFRLVPRAITAGQAGALQFDLIGPDGIAWFYVATLYASLNPQGQRAYPLETLVPTPQ